MVVYHHTDMDGKSAGWLVHAMHPFAIEDHPEKYIMTDYGDKFDKHNEKDDVVIVDVSISDTTYEDFLNICKTARSVTWIDHHQTSLDIIEKHKEELQAIPNLTYFVSKCACGAALTYSFFKIPQEDLMTIRQTSEDEEYDISAKYDYCNMELTPFGVITITMLKKNKKNPTDYITRDIKVKLPTWLFYVDDYDSWKQLHPNSNLFSLGFDSEETSIAILNDNEVYQFNQFWTWLTSNQTYVNDIVSAGRNIDKYIKARYAKELSSTFEWEYNGTTFICKNAHGNSWNFGELIKKYPAAILFNYDGKSGKWDYSVYSDESSKFDCKAFCESFGGGGHLHASGFQIKELIFTNMPKSKDNVIFLGGTCNEDKWREKFISLWKNKDDEKIKGIKLFDPIVPDWNNECKKKENEVKSSSIMNLFVITPNQKGYFSFAEIADCAHYSKVFFAVLDEHNQFDKDTINSFNDIGELVEAHEGIYKVYDGEDGLKSIIDDIIAAL